ncbi:hypothetical protein [Chitinimonas koreensis]|uniref:hypothetical protein n=1 Tax=Chitinimonas koreensis TaxID=356302 RepID=UPI0003F7D15D|nr:hypothetical protein [Chitinimonas koreensis]QNM95907.1 hypothetical protein H9L41_19070 [Chitinimonas koreensis]
MLRNLVILAGLAAATGLAGCASHSPAPIPKDEMQTDQITLARDIGVGEVAPVPEKVASRFAMKDGTVNVFVVLSWNPADKPLGKRPIRWVWYDGSGERQLAQLGAEFNFNAAPYTVHGSMATKALGPGAHRVKLFVDGIERADKEFRID